MTARAVALLCLTALVAADLDGWNGAGHRAIAALAYAELTPRARQRVRQILQAHPDYHSILKLHGVGDASAFEIAAKWPDLIRNDPRFSDEPGSHREPLPGFPDMRVHAKWHFINTPYPAEFAGEAVDPENAVSQIRAFASALKHSGRVTPEQAYALPWLIHLVGDIHQPLHAVTRFQRRNGRTEHDRGGGRCFVRGSSNLHSFWDGLLGSVETRRFIGRLALSLGREHPRPKQLELDPKVWASEGAAMAGSSVYSFSVSCDDHSRPARLPDAYRLEARRIARHRAALAAHRLAALLNSRLDPPRK